MIRIDMIGLLNIVKVSLIVFSSFIDNCESNEGLAAIGLQVKYSLKAGLSHLEHIKVIIAISHA